MKKNRLIEVIVITSLFLVTFRFFSAWSANYASLFLAAGLIYVPILVLWIRKEPINFLEKHVNDIYRGFTQFLKWAIIILIPYFGAAYFCMFNAFGYESFSPASFPDGSSIFYQLVMVAFVEEFYFRGYVQSALNQVYKPKWSIFGTKLGWAWILTAFIFAFAHSAISVQWWHFSIFFPALAFGFLRERTGGLTACVLFHTASNLLGNWIIRSFV